MNETLLYGIRLVGFLTFFTTILSCRSQPPQVSPTELDLRPNPSLAHLRRVAIDPQTGTAIIVGFEGCLLYSHDRGLTWNLSRDAGNTRFYGLDLKPEYAWAVGFEGAIWYSLDQGHTWQSRSPARRERLMGIWFSDPQHGTAVGDDGLIISTDNGGESWLVRHHQPGGRGLRDVTRIRDTEIAVGYGGTVFSSHDQGRTWSELSIDTGFQAYAVHAVNDSHLFVTGSLGLTFSSTDAGRTWVKMPTPTFNYMRDVFFLSQSEGWLAGYGRIYHTTDAGGSWHKTSLQERYQLQGIAFHPDGWGLAVGADGIILRSVDRGETWNLIGPESTTLRSLAIAGTATTTYGFCVGDHGTILLTQDNFDVWQAAPLRVSRVLTSAAVAKSGALWLVGAQAFCKSTTDKGLSWEVHTIPVRGDYQGIRFIPNGYGAVWSNDGPPARTTDNGNSWQSLALPTASVVTNMHLLESNWYAVVAQGPCFHSSDFGNTWTGQDLGVVQRLTCCAFTQDGRGLVAGEEGMVLMTYNHGANSSWQELDLNWAGTYTAMATNGKWFWLGGARGVLRGYEFESKAIVELELSEQETIFDLLFFKDDLLICGGRGLLRMVKGIGDGGKPSLSP